MKYIVNIFFILILSCQTHNTNGQMEELKKAGYNFDNVQRFDLPAIANEISGIAYFDEQKIAFIQDEQGIIFIYDLIQKKIVNQYSFGQPSDYEDISFNKGIFFVLKSNGTVFSVSISNSETKTEILETKVPAFDSEGLFFDGNKLLIACKENVEKEEKETTKFVYEFDLSTKQLNPTPFLKIEYQEILSFSKTLNTESIDNQDNKKKKKEKIKFKPSAISRHPITNEIYILSAKDRLLAIYGTNKNLKNVIPLPKESFAKPEGLCFLPDGTMLISNEIGNEAAANILLFRYENIK